MPRSAVETNQDKKVESWVGMSILEWSGLAPLQKSYLGGLKEEREQVLQICQRRTGF